MLEDITGLRVFGYRAASFSIADTNDWAHDVLAGTGHVSGLRHSISLITRRVPTRPSASPDRVSVWRIEACASFQETRVGAAGGRGLRNAGGSHVIAWGSESGLGVATGYGMGWPPPTPPGRSPVAGLCHLR